MISCTACRAILPRGEFTASGPMACGACGKVLQVEFFPALWRTAAKAEAGSDIPAEGQTRCFFHEKKPAVRACDGCGRFLCSLCDLELGQRHLCPSCIDSGKAKGKLKTLENHRVLWDGIALSVAILPMLIFWLTLVTAPVVLFLVVRHWRSPGSILPRSKARFIIAGGIAVLQLGGWTLAFIGLMGV